MKKRILGFTVLALSALSLASCGGNNSTPIDKGSSVDSITFKNKKNEDVTIKKTDNIEYKCKHSYGCFGTFFGKQL